MREVFAKAGYTEDVNLLSIPNEYWKDDCEPWYLAQVGDRQPIKIGWRKRVINIDWSASKKNLGHLFETEDVSKDSDYIHAWGYEKASEYLVKIIPHL